MEEPSNDDRVSVLRAENARLRLMLDQRGMPASLRHQVRNVLGMLRGIIRRSAETSLSVSDYAAHLEGRFDAILRVQALIAASAGESVDLHAMVSNELLAHLLHEGEKVALSGPDVRLPARTAEYLGLAIHELAANAIKFGALPLPSGRLTVAWGVMHAPPRLSLTWSETGSVDGAPGRGPNGFGMEAIEMMLPYQLKAQTEVEFGPEGLRCVIRLPLTAVSV